MFRSPRALILLVGATLVLVGAIVGISTVFSSPDTVTITSTDSDYRPGEISVPVGTTVVWENISDNAHWPASNIHPTHDQYPATTGGDCLGSAFDACRSITPGKTYAFTFTRPGAWDFHDHLAPARGGTVHVYETTTSMLLHQAWNAVVDVVHDATSGLFGPPLSLPAADAFFALSFAEKISRIDEASSEHPSRTWQYLKDVSMENGKVVYNAHDLAHIIGNNLYEAQGLSGITVCDQTFAFGCIHGVTEQMLITEGPQVLDSLSSRCRDVYPAGDSDVVMGYSGCIHGVGHGLLSWSGLDTKTALVHCDTLPQRDRTYCYDGVFMEYTFSAPDSAFSATDPWRMCRGLDERYQYNCARYQGTVFRKLDFSLQESANACISAPTRQTRQACIDDIGYYIAQQHPQASDDIVADCTVFTADAHARCVTAAAGELVFQSYDNWKQNARMLCDALTSDARADCHARNENIAAEYGRE